MIFEDGRPSRSAGVTEEHQNLNTAFFFAEVVFWMSVCCISCCLLCFLKSKNTAKIIELPAVSQNNNNLLEEHDSEQNTTEHLLTSQLLIGKKLGIHETINEVELNRKHSL